WVEGDDKWLVLSSEEKFSIKLVGTDTGTMDYTVYGYDFETESITQTKAYTNVTLENGKRFTSEVDALAGVAEVPLFVADVNGNPVREVLQDGTEIPCSATKFVSLFNWQTKYESNFWNWFKFIVLFGWIWMWFI
ncbi:MAG: hypothetical protein FWC26_00620, partial [Fibromonadales bacterium]|nr:hypothetical protein [Fibromonadales bacterium]